MRPSITGDSAPDRGQRRYRLSLSLRLAATTLAVLCAVSLILYWQLSRHELSRLVEGKRTAVAMLADLVAEDLRAPLDFSDEDALALSLNYLKRNPDIVQVVIWSDTADAPLAAFSRDGSPVAIKPHTSDNRVLADRVVARRLVLGRYGAQVGALELVASLERENADHRNARSQLLALSALLALGTAALLIFATRRQVVAPLARLARAAHRIERGVSSARAEVRSDDEIGDLGVAFNRMADAIGDREQKLALATQNLRDLFDHMRQAIVAVDADGRVRGDVSRSALLVFGRDSLDGCSARELLYAGKPSYDVSACAFDEWLELAFSCSPDQWADCEALAPHEVTTDANGSSVQLELEFRPLVKSGRVTRVMILATDVSIRRTLERAVVTQEAEYGRRLAAMRRLVAGGSQVFLGFVELARTRLDRCEALVTANPVTLPGDAIDELFRQVHTIRGEARGFDMSELESEAAKLEEDFEELRARARGDGFAVTGSAQGRLDTGLRLAREALEKGCHLFAAASPIGRAVFHQVTVQAKDLQELVALVGDRNDEVGALARRLVSSPFGLIAASVIESAPGWALSDGKSVSVELETRELMIPAPLARVLPGILAHLVRNSVAHGIETPEQRKAAGKREEGTIVIRGEEVANGVRISVFDDGRGLDLGRLAQAADAAGIACDASAAAELVFAPGISTRDEVDELAGRGVGLDAVRRQLGELAYDVSVRFEAGRATWFSIAPASLTQERHGAAAQ